jgi:hypothetical protein
MKNSIEFSKSFMIASTVVLCLLTGATAPAQSQTTRLRIGVYDSRAVAVAYANSPEFGESLNGMRAEHQKAKAAKDEKTMKQIEARMKLRQLRMHEQGFSTGSVADIMAKVKGALPDVARKAGVQAIVSKWELNYQSPEVETVDVTDEVAGLFHASDKGRKWVKEIRAKAPVPMDDITDDMD